MKSWKLQVIPLVVIVVFVLGACANLGNLFYTAPSPEGYGTLTIRNIDSYGQGLRSVIVNGITDQTYSWSWGHLNSGMLGSRTNIPPNGTLSVGHEIEWTDIKDGEEKQVKRRLLPFGEYEITVFWHIQHQSGENFYTRYRVSVNNSRNELEVQVPYSVIRQMGL